MTKWLFAAALAVACAQAGAATWNVFADDSDGQQSQLTFFDADSVVRKGDTVTMLFEQLRDAEASPSDPMYRTDMRMSFHCGAGTVEAGDRDIVDLDGDAMHRARSAHAMKPDPVSDEGHWLKAACSPGFPTPQARGDFSRVPRNDPGALALDYFRAQRAKLAAMNNDHPQEQPRAPREDCAGLQFSFASSLKQLPAGLLPILEKRGRVADRGGKVNLGDVIFDDTPRRRFDGAAVSAQRVYLVVEQGGLASNTQMWRFTRDGGGWRGKHLWYIGTPQTLQDVLSTACRQYAPPPPPDRPKHPSIGCTEDDARSISVTYLDAEVSFSYTLDRKAVARGIARQGRVVVSPSGDREPTPDERASALALLQAGRASPDNHCPAATLDEFMQALAGHERSKPIGKRPAPSPADAWLAQAKAAAERGDARAQLEALNRACSADPRSADAFAARASYFDFAIENEKALADYSTALRLDPSGTEVRFGRAYLVFNHQMEGKARELAAHDLAILDREVSPGSQRRQVMASMYSALDMPRQQIVQLDKWMALHGENEWGSSLADRCWARVLLNTELRQALSDCDKVVALAPDGSPANEYRGWLWLRLGEPAKALSDFDRAYAKDGNAHLALYGRAVAHERLGQAEAAAADFAKVRRTFPYVDSEAAKKGLVPHSAITEAQDHDLAKLLARMRAQQ